MPGKQEQLELMKFTGFLVKFKILNKIQIQAFTNYWKIFVNYTSSTERLLTCIFVTLSGKMTPKMA